MLINLERYAGARRALQLKGAFFVALGALGLSFTGLFVIFGLHEIISPGPVHPDHNRREGAGVLCVVLVPFVVCGLLLRRGIALWRSAGVFDRLIALVAKQPTNLSDLSTALQKLVNDGVSRGFIEEPSNAELRVVGVVAPVAKPGNGALLATLAGHGYGVLCVVLMALEKHVGRDAILFVCVPGVPLTFALHTVGVVAGIKGRRAALASGVLGYLAVVLLIFGTALELVFGPR